MKILAILFTILFFSCQNPKKIIISDPDYSSKMGTQIISEKYAISGSKSVKLDSNNIYGLSISIHQQKLGEVYEASVFRKGNNGLVTLAVNADNGFFRSNNWVFNKIGEWEEIKLRFKINNNLKNEPIRVFVYNPNKFTVYVDSLSLRKIDIEKETNLPNFVFYPLFFKIYNHYHLLNLEVLNSENLLSYYKNIDNVFFKNSSTSKEIFLKTLKHHINELGVDQIIDKMIKYRNAISFEQKISLQTDLEKVNEIAAYSQQIIYDIKDQVVLETISKNNKNYSLEIFKIVSQEKFVSIKKFIKQTSKTISFDAKELGKGFFKIKVSSGSNVFYYTIIINENHKNETIVIAPYTTWHAYNSYGGKSFYINSLDDKEVNFLTTLRPINSINYNITLCNIYTLKNIFDWFDQYNASIYPDYYLEAHPELFDNCKTLIISQHVEYVSPKMYKKIKDISKTGNIISLGGNQIYWKIKWHDNFTKIECQKGNSFFENTTIPGGLWRDNITSEASFLGVAYSNSGYDTYAPYKVVNEKHWIFKNTNLQNEDLFGQKGINGLGICGDETDKQIQGTHKDAVLLAKGTNPNNGGGEITIIERGKYATYSTSAITSGNGLFLDENFSLMMKNFMKKYHH